MVPTHAKEDTEKRFFVFLSAPCLLCPYCLCAISSELLYFSTQRSAISAFDVLRLVRANAPIRIPTIAPMQRKLVMLDFWIVILVFIMSLNSLYLYYGIFLLVMQQLFPKKGINITTKKAPSGEAGLEALGELFMLSFYLLFSSSAASRLATVSAR